MTEVTAGARPSTAIDHPPPRGPRPGCLNGRYTVTKAIARDEDTTTFRAYDPVLSRAVAVTLFPTADPRRHRRWREARILAGLDHPYLLDVHDAGEHGGWAYLVTRLVDGPVLADRLRTEVLSVEEMVGLGARLADALACVHRRGLTHRALTPRSVLLDHTGRPCLRDFSLAATTEATAITADHLDTAEGCYLAPEQVAGETVGPPADVYALGLILLEAVSGHREYPGSPVEAANAHLERPPTIPAQLPSPVAAVLSAMTAHDADARPPSAQLATDLRRAGGAVGHQPHDLSATHHPDSPGVAGPAVAGSDVTDGRTEATSTPCWDTVGHELAGCADAG